MNSLYEKASLLVLSSRLDPLPNVAIDAICEGLPIVCFDKASGIADVLKAHGLQQQCVAEYINTTDMAQKALNLLEESVEPVVRKALQGIGSEAFSMQKYCSDLIEMQVAASSRWKSASAKVDELLERAHGKETVLGVRAWYAAKYVYSKAATRLQSPSISGAALVALHSRTAAAPHDAV